MLTILTAEDHSPLFHEYQLTIPDEEELALHVGRLIMGYHRHVAEIIAAKKIADPPTDDQKIDMAIAKLTIPSGDTPYKRDGWVFQLITWIAIREQYSGALFRLQIPHDAPAQHGLDGLGVLLSPGNRLQALIITEDKYTENPRKLVKEQIWPEFKEFEKGTYDDKLVSRASGLLTHLDYSDFEQLIRDDIFNKDLRHYRAGITPEESHHKSVKRKKNLFKNYDNKVKGNNCLRRNGITFYQPDIRDWMDKFCLKVINKLNAQR